MRSSAHQGLAAGGFWLSICVSLGACSASSSDGTTVRSPVIYGTDDRQEFGQIAEPQLRDLVGRSSLAFIDGAIAAIADGTVALSGTTWAEVDNLCPDVPFATDPIDAYCSATLIEPDLVLTAGHCLRASDCSTMTLVPGFWRDDRGVIQPVRADDLRFCAQVLAWDDGEEGSGADFAWIKLDRPLVMGGGPPVTVFGDPSEMALGEPLTSFGYGGGGPGKLLRGRMTSHEADGEVSFMSDLDSFRGMSGAPIWDEHDRLVGVVNRGATDLSFDMEQGCNEVVRLADGAGQEASTSATYALDRLCEASPAHRVCGWGDGSGGAGCATAGGRSDPAGVLALLALLGLLSRRRRDSEPLGPKTATLDPSPGRLRETGKRAPRDAVSRACG